MGLDWPRYTLEHDSCDSLYDSLVTAYLEVAPLTGGAAELIETPASEVSGVSLSRARLDLLALSLDLDPKLIGREVFLLTIRLD